MLKGEHLYEEFPKRELKPTAVPRELIRCWDEVSIDGNGKKQVKKISLMRPCEIPQFRTLFFSRCMDLYNTWKLFKQSPPLGQGWGNERGVTCQILKILEVENNKYEAWERDKKDAKKSKR